MVPASSLTNHAVFPKLDNDDGEYDASGDNSSVNAVPFHVTPTISLTAGAHGDSPSTKLVVSALTVLESIGDISVINDNSTKDAPGAMEEEHMNCPTPWPPPYLYLSWCDSSPRPIPWPSFAILPPGSQFWVSPLHICLHYEPDREKDFTNLQRKDRDDQFNSRSVSLNVLEKFLKKPCTEPEEAIVSGLISKGATSVFKLWHVAWALPIFVPSKFARRGMEGTTPCRVLGIMRCFQLQRHALLFAYFAYMSLDSSSFVCAREELFWEREELELNDRVSYMLEQYNDNSICGIETELQSLCESTCRPLIQVAAIPHSNKEMELRMAARELCILLNDSLQHLDDSVPCCVLQCRFVLILWKIEWSLHWEHSENARTGFNNNLLLDVIKANLIFLCYGAGGIATWSVFTTTFRPAVASALIDTMKRNNSKRSCRTLILTFLQASDVIGCELWSQFGTMIMLVWSSPSMALLNGGKQGSNLYKLSPALLFRWQHVKNTKWSWDPGGCAFALCSSERTWPTLHYHAHLLRPSLQCSGAFLIWLVAWILVGFELSTFRGQAPFQEGRDVLRADCSYKVYVSRHDYIRFVNQIPVGHEYYLNKACYFNTVCSDSSKTKEVHMPWDPGKSVLQCLLKIWLGDKPSFKKVGMSRPSRAHLSGPLPWAHNYRLGPAQSQPQFLPYKYQMRVNEELIEVESETDGGKPFPPT